MACRKGSEGSSMNVEFFLQKLHVGWQAGAGACGLGRKMAPELVELELQMAVNHHAGSGNQTQAGVSSPAPVVTFY